MRRVGFFFALAMIALSAILALRPGSPAGDLVESKARSVVEKSESVASTSDATVPTAKPRPEPSSAVRKPVSPRLRSALPPASSLRAEAAHDPHSSPPSLGTFARELEGMIAEALHDPLSAAALVEELSSCALGRMDAATQSTAVRVHCVRKLRVLGRAYPGRFDERVAGVERALDRRSKLILDAMER